MGKSKLPIVLAVLVVLAAAVVVLVLPRRVPEAVRLLPEADAVVYVDLRLLRRAGVTDGLPEVVREADYDEFVRQTGFQFERDLDQMATAVHLGGFGGRPAEAAARYSHIFAGRFDPEAASAYFRGIARQVEQHEGTEIFHIPVEERTVRVAILGRGLVAVSNAVEEGPLRQIIEHHRGRMPLRGPELVREHYRRVPRGSIAWAVSRAAPDGRGGARIGLPGGFDVGLPEETVLLASVRYVGVAQLRAEAITRSEAEARRIVNNLNAYLAIFRAMTGQVEVADRDVTAFFESLEARQEGERAVISATMSNEFLRKLRAPAAEEAEGEPEEEEP